MKRLFLLLGCLLCLVGCSNKIEMSELGIVSGFGIDQTENGYRLSAQVINPSSVAGNHQDTLPVYILEAEGVSLYDAYRELNTMTSKTLYLPHLRVIVIDEAIAKKGINEVLDFTLRNVKIRPNISLVVANESPASEILKVLVPSETVPINQLDAVANICETCTSRVVRYNLYDVSGKVNAKGDNIVLNRVSIKGAKSETGEDVENILESFSPTQLQINGLAAFNSDQMVGYLTNQEAEIFNLLANQGNSVVIDKKQEDYWITFEGRNGKVEIKPNIDAKKVTVKCEIKGELMEINYPIDLSNPKNLADLEQYLADDVKAQVEALLKKSQEELKSDIFGVGSKVYQKEPKYWSQIEGYWNEIYPELTFEVDVKVKVASVGDIQNLVEQ